MTTELDLTARLRALRVDPPDDGFMERFAAQLEQEPAPVRREGKVLRPFGRRRGLLLLSAAAVFISGGALAFLKVSPLGFRAPVEPVPVEKNVEAPRVEAAETPARRVVRTRPEVAPPEPLLDAKPEPPLEAPPRAVPERLPSPIEPSRAAHAPAVERPSLRQESARPHAGPRDVGRRAVPELPSPVEEREARPTDERRERPRSGVPRLNADLRPAGRERPRPERSEQRGEEERGRRRPRSDEPPRRDVERTRERERGDRAEQRGQERERRRSE
jgi:hypothetical protein